MATIAVWLGGATLAACASSFCFSQTRKKRRLPIGLGF